MTTIQRQGYTLDITRQETQEDQEPISIYKITNTQTGQAYVGQTRNVLRRMHEHLSASGSLLLHDAFLDYGVKNFTFLLIHTDIAYDTALADLIENYFIMKEDTLYPKGYNLRLNDIPKIHSDSDCLSLYGAKFVFIHNPSGLKAFTVSQVTSARGFQQLDGLNLCKSHIITKKLKDGFAYYELLLQTDNSYDKGQRYDLHLKYLPDEDSLVFV